MMFSYVAVGLRMSGLKVPEHLGRISIIKIEVMTLVAFLQTFRYGVISRLALDDMTCVCCEVCVLVWVAQGTVRKWFEVGIFRVLRRMHYNPISAILVIACLAEVDWKATAVE